MESESFLASYEGRKNKYLKSEINDLTLQEKLPKHHNTPISATTPYQAHLHINTNQSQKEHMIQHTTTMSRYQYDRE